MRTTSNGMERFWAPLTVLLSYLRSPQNRISLISLLLGIVFCFVLPQITASTGTEVLTYFATMLMMGASYVMVSRMRNRNSFWFFVLASTGSNGLWYLSLAVLYAADIPWYYIFLAVTAVLAGRTVGVNIAMHLEKKYKLISDVVRNPSSVTQYLRTAKRGWAILGSTLMAYMLWLGLTEPQLFFAAVVVMLLGFLQNLFYTQNTRLMQRGKDNPATVRPIAVLSVVTSLVFFCSLAYLASNKLTLLLFIPYTLTTVLGSTSGVMKSMYRELRMEIAGDDHINKTQQQRLRKRVTGSLGELSRESLQVYVTLLVTGTTWLLFHEGIAAHLNISLPVLAFPFGDVETSRTVTLFTIATLVLLQQFAHALVSSAAVRNHVGYHAVCILLDMSLDFLKLFAILKNPTWDIIPVAIVAGAAGLLFARTISALVEKLLEARMDELENT